MADASRGRSILDAYSDSTGDTDATAATSPSRGASILDAYQTQAAAPAVTAPAQDPYSGAPTSIDYQPDYAALGRIGTAAAGGWEGVPAIPRVPSNLVMAPVYNPLLAGVETAFRAGGAVLRGGQQAVVEATPDIHLGSVPTIPLGGGRFISGELTPGSLGREIAALPEAFPFGFNALRAPGRPPIPEAPPPGPRFMSEITAPPRPPGMTDAERINQLVEHAVNEEQPAVGPPMETGLGYRPDVDPTKPFTYNPPSSGWPAGTERWAEGEVPATAAVPPQVTPVPSGAVPMTSDAARGVAKSYYDTFDRAAQDGGSLTPQATNKFIASVEAVAPKPGIGQAVAGKNTITDLVERLQDYKNQPMSLQDAHVVDQQLGNLIAAEYSKTGVSSIGRELQNIQHTFRDQLSNPEPGDVVSGQAGLDALAPARKAYSQAMKLDTIERIQERANMTDNPSTSFRTQVRTLLNDDRRSRGFSDEEKDALRAAANRGAAATALHVLGSRLIPIISGSTGTGAGFFGAGPVGAFFGATAGATAGHLLNEAARAGENALAARRLQNAYTVLGKSVPPNPLQEAPPP